MSIVALIGDCTTTTAVAMAAAWPIDRDVVVLEADRTGGSLAGWLDTPTTPSLTTLVAARRSGLHPGSTGHIRDDRTTWADVVHAVQHSAAGIRFIAAPVRSREAALAITEAERTLIPMLAGLESPTVIADVGRRASADPLPAIVLAATTTLVLHRQEPSSAGAAAVRLDRLVEVIEQLAPTQARILLGVIGDQPFDVREIGEHVASNTTTSIAVALPIALDPFSASVLAGRSGVSAVRLARLPLARSVAALTNELVSNEREPVEVAR